MAALVRRLMMVALLTSLYFIPIQSLCPQHCLNNTNCDVEVDGGCPKCMETYYGRQCQYRTLAQEDNSNILGIPKIAVGFIITALAIGILIVLGTLILRRLSTKYPEKNDNEMYMAEYVFGKDDHSLLNNELNSGGSEAATDMYGNLQISNEYGNTGFSWINIKELPSFIENADKIKQQFESVEKFPLHEQTIAKEKENASKNKYKYMYPYDNNRVILDTSDGGGDYINASPIKNKQGVTQFIAAQGPIATTHIDFWRMVWQKNICKIVMLTLPIEKGTVKCITYWPENKELQLGYLTIVSKGVENFSDHVLRTLQISKGDESRIIYLFHFTSWPDKSVPDDPLTLALFHRVVVNYTNVPNIPTLVHCSAGVGRTGTYISLHMLLEEAIAMSRINPLECLKHLRQQRINMIQTPEQYFFLHQCVWKAWKIDSTCMSITEFGNIYKKKKQKKILDDEFKTLQMPDINKLNTSSGRANENANKNRYEHILPVEEFRPFLQGSEPCSDYINAVFATGVHQKREYILTQSPLPNTVVDFWKLIFQEDVKCIIHLGYKYEESCGVYYEESEMKFGQITVKRISDIRVGNDYIITELEISKGAECKLVEEVTATCWKKKEVCPKSAQYILNLIDKVDKMNTKPNEESPMLIHCLDGATKSGLFCILHSVISRIKTDKLVMIPTVVEQLRKSRPQILSSQEQYEFVCDCVNIYLDNSVANV